MIQHSSFPQEAQGVIALLAARNIAASFEFPGVIHVPLANGFYLNAGKANGPWGADVTDAEGRTKGLFELARSADSEDAAFAIWAHVMALRSPHMLFSCRASWGEGTNELPISHFVEILATSIDSENRATLERLFAAKVGEAITSIEPFNGTETFTRIA